jgi:hypothetical protein
MIPKKRTCTTKYDREIQKLFDQFVEETGNRDIEAFLDWAEPKGAYKVSKMRVRRQFARDVAQALSKDYIEGETGQPVRRRHCYRTPTQLTLWKKIEDLTRDEMGVSYQITRGRVGGQVFQKQRDIDYFNRHYNPGDPIETSWNYDKDLDDRNMPTDYPDEPPPEES